MTYYKMILIIYFEINKRIRNGDRGYNKYLLEASSKTMPI